MANICENTFFATSEDKNNLQYIKNFLEENIIHVDTYLDDNYIEAYFDSKWTFPEEVMKDMFKDIPNKDDIFIRCLSVEYGCLYHALWICEKEGWREV